MSSQSEKIAALVASLKAGEITKEELFARLQSLQQAKAAAAPQTSAAAASPAPGPQGNEPVSPGASSVSRGGAPAGDAFAGAVAAGRAPAAPAADARSPAALQDAYAAYLQNTQQAVAAAAAAGSAPAGAAPAEAAGGRRPSTAGSTGRRASVSSVRSEGGEPRGRRDRDLGSSSSQYGAADDAECTFQPRTTQLPAHYGSNAQYVLQSIPFRDRAYAWARHREQELSRLAHEAASKEIEECTFKPNVNPPRARSASRGRAGAPTPSREEAAMTMTGGQGPIHERLYAHVTASIARARTPVATRRRPTSAGPGSTTQFFAASSLGASGVGAAGGATGGALPPRPSTAAAKYLEGGRPLFTSPTTGSPRHTQPLRLYPEPTPAELAATNGGVLPVADPYYRAVPTVLTREEEELIKECTFKPKINSPKDAAPVRSRYKQALEKKAAKAKAGDGEGAQLDENAGGHTLPKPTGTEECTFKPRTNPVKPSLMPAAALYVQAPIFERLARTHTHAQRQREDAVKNGDRASRPGYVPENEDGSSSLAGGEGRRSVSAARSEGGMSAEDPDARQRRLADFIARQQAALERKAAHVAELEAATAPVGQPQLCARSLAIADNLQRGAFLDRLATNTVRREAESHTLKTKAAVEPECTFKPAINPVSKSLKPRSIEELSVGDALKRETAHRLLRLRTEQEALASVNFKPTINDKSRQLAGAGRLRILEEPDTYVNRLQQEAAIAAEKARQAAAQAEQMELSECTFKPSIHDAPEYVKRIAKSMALARAVRPADGTAVDKPEWR